MRRALESLYTAAGCLAAVFMVGTLAMVVLGIAGRMLNFYVRGTDAYAGYCMAAAGFLALAHTLRRGEHIRVTLVRDRLAGGRRRALDVVAWAVGTFFGSVFAWYSARLAWQSHAFNDVSTANDATPLWMPQLAMAAGSAVLLIALVDGLATTIAGGDAVRGATSADPAHVE